MTGKEAKERLWEAKKGLTTYTSRLSSLKSEIESMNGHEVNQDRELFWLYEKLKRNLDNLEKAVSSL